VLRSTMWAVVAPLSLSLVQRPQPQMGISRRAAATSLFIIPAMRLPSRASADPFNPGLMQDLAGLLDAKNRLQDVSQQMSHGFGDSEDDAIVVLRTSSLYFSSVPKIMDKAVEAMPLLTSDEKQRSLGLARQFGENIQALTAACRQHSSKEQLAAAIAARDTLSEYLSVAAKHYTVLESKVVPYSTSPSEFAAQYFGIFSCEGQGLERMPGSNSCKDSSKGSKKNPNAFKLDFDFLTGRKL